MRTLFLYTCDGGPNDGEMRASIVDHPDELDTADQNVLIKTFAPALDHPNPCSMYVVTLGDGVAAPMVTDEYGDEVFQLYSDLR